MSERTLIRGVSLDGASVDVLIDGGVIVGLAARIDDHDVDHRIDADGGALLPGLHDHHVHLLAMAARATSVDLDACATPNSADSVIAAAVAAVAAAAEATGAAGGAPMTAVGAPVAGWVRVVGYDEHRHGVLDLRRLDALGAAAAVRVQHRSGLSWILSSEALRRVDAQQGPVAIVERDASGTPTGWIHRGDDWLGARIERQELSLAPVSRRLAALGITGVTDATAEPGEGRLDRLREARASGELRQHVMLLGPDEPIPGFVLGPRKLLVDEMLGLDPDALAMRIAEVHRTGRAVALHAVSRVENIAAVTALQAAGARRGDRIEHGSIMPFELDPILAAAAITVIIQPALVGERGDHHLVTVEPDEMALLHRQASFIAAGVRLAAGSDAPVTAIDPWRAIATAMSRRTRTGALVGESERVDARTALGWYLSDPRDPGGPPRRVALGTPADLCLLDVPLETMLSAPDASHVRSTWIDGVMVDP